jgi:hypothetical protein
MVYHSPRRAGPSRDSDEPGAVRVRAAGDQRADFFPAAGRFLEGRAAGEYLSGSIEQ